MQPIPAANPTRSSLVVDVPRQTSWHVPRGQYFASIQSVNVLNRLAKVTSVKIVRLVFKVHVPKAALDYLAKIELKLDLNEGSELWNLLCRLLGRKAMQDRSGQTINLESLAGLVCDVEIDHNSDQIENYSFPLVFVADVQEAGRLVKPSVEQSILKDGKSNLKDGRSMLNHNLLPL